MNRGFFTYTTHSALAARRYFQSDQSEKQPARICLDESEREPGLLSLTRTRRSRTTIFRSITTRVLAIQPGQRSALDVDRRGGAAT